MSEASLACTQCGADLAYDPSVTALSCPYCGMVNQIEPLDDVVGEQDYESALSDQLGSAEAYEVATIKCGSCGADSTFDAEVAGDVCPFCGEALVAASELRQTIKPQAVLPFKVSREQAREAFRSWRASLWFAPSALKRAGSLSDRLQGVFLPFWTYDADCSTAYMGQRGEHYYVSRTQMVRLANGKMAPRQTKVRRTRWFPARGQVRDAFDDVLVVGSRSLPTEHLGSLEPWDLGNLIGYSERYLAGFRTERYSVSLEDGLARAKLLMEPRLRLSVRRDIGGDTQKIQRMETAYRSVTFKHVLLPVWISSYRYRSKVYRFLINARTGEVRGDRPYSKVKIAFAILVGLIGASLLALLSQGR